MQNDKKLLQLVLTKSILMANIISITAILVIFLCVAAAAASRSLVGLDGMSVAVNDGICKSMVVSQGYDCHEHTITTKDGYILSMQHIPSGRSGKKADKPPVLLQHGLLMDACTWVLNSPQESLAFILADNGFDVWLANTRGTKYSRGHTSLTPNDPAYWYWSWDELAAYDLSSSVQFVYNQTAGQKLHYVGHSLGTLIALAAFSQDQTVNILRSAALLSPIAHLGQMPSLLARAAAEAFIGEALYWLGIREFAPGGEAVAKLLQDICNTPGANCSDLMSSFTGPNCCVNSSMTNNFLKHEPQSTATKNMIHLAQMIREGTVAMYDYGNTDQNMEQYGQPNPPLYNMTSIPNDFPLYFGYGGKDMLSDVKDVHVLLDSLKSHESDKMVAQFQADYAHADFVFGVNANQVVYNPLMAFFKLN